MRARSPMPSPPLRNERGYVILLTISILGALVLGFFALNLFSTSFKANKHYSLYGELVTMSNNLTNLLDVGKTVTLNGGVGVIGCVTPSAINLRDLHTRPVAQRTLLYAADGSPLTQADNATRTHRFGSWTITGACVDYTGSTYETSGAISSPYCIGLNAAVFGGGGGDLDTDILTTKRFFIDPNSKRSVSWKDVRLHVSPYWGAQANIPSGVYCQCAAAASGVCLIP
jgi:hypothetical protein